jgi:ubiquinone/menaquinone biosynthesis C-methylase UbiE
MAKRARARLRPNVELSDARAEDLPFEDDSFDVVVSTLVLCTVDDVPRTLREIARVLRPGGQLVFIEHVRADGVFGRVQDIVQPVYGWMSGGCHANRHTEAALRNAGFAFEEIEHARLTLGVPGIVGRARIA